MSEERLAKIVLGLIRNAASSPATIRAREARRKELAEIKAELAWRDKYATTDSHNRLFAGRVGGFAGCGGTPTPGGRVTATSPEIGDRTCWRTAVLRERMRFLSGDEARRLVRMRLDYAAMREEAERLTR